MFCFIDIDANSKYSTAFSKFHGSLITHKMPLIFSVGMPTQLEFVRSKFSEEIGAYICNFIKSVDLDNNFYGFVWRNLSCRRMYLVMRGVVALYFEPDKMSITLILQFQVPID